MLQIDLNYVTARFCGGGVFSKPCLLPFLVIIKSHPEHPWSSDDVNAYTSMIPKYLD